MVMPDMQGQTLNYQLSDSDRDGRQGSVEYYTINCDKKAVISVALYPSLNGPGCSNPEGPANYGTVERDLELVVHHERS